jgi:hypothetical protein
MLMVIAVLHWVVWFLFCISKEHCAWYSPLRCDFVYMRFFLSILYYPPYLLILPFLPSLSFFFFFIIWFYYMCRYL